MRDLSNLVEPRPLGLEMVRRGCRPLQEATAIVPFYIGLDVAGVIRYMAAAMRSRLGYDVAYLVATSRGNEVGKWLALAVVAVD